MGFLDGKKALISGVASNRSIAFGVAQCLHREGAELAFTYQTDKLKPRVEKIAAELGSSICIPLDVSNDQNITDAFAELKQNWETFDIMIHSIAFAPMEELKGSFVESVTREGFKMAHEISSYSFASMAREAKPMLNDNASLLTMTYLGSVKSVPNYNVMGPAKASLESTVRFLAADLGPQGIRVNAISAGPIKTLAAAGVSGFRGLLKHVASKTSIRRNVTIEDVGNTAAFLSSDLASGITGETIYVDGGYRNLGMTFDMK
ncbi:MAG: enoyl-ACP reductase [Gammaproteobacteria bacterium]|jgi:enoyl-[acyl-carrier protein] reductase I|nr:enoyl-ACP reductase [Gammaproteobacteria bacterium]MDC0189169.1 enoyl-ACP reductase [Gammaproteobacteria bacterium]|tara:strand:+ start:902 stop:1687 length:786 start_codon:yes stop_codon:yes gene_type:complete